MKQMVILVVLSLLTLAGAVIEAIFQNLPESLVQANGLMTILFAMVFVIFTLKLKARGFKGTE